MRELPLRCLPLLCSGVAMMEGRGKQKLLCSTVGQRCACVCPCVVLSCRTVWSVSKCAHDGVGGQNRCGATHHRRLTCTCAVMERRRSAVPTLLDHHRAGDGACADDATSYVRQPRLHTLHRSTLPDLWQTHSGCEYPLSFVVNPCDAVVCSAATGLRRLPSPLRLHSTAHQ